MVDISTTKKRASVVLMHIDGGNENIGVHIWIGCVSGQHGSCVRVVGVAGGADGRLIFPNFSTGEQRRFEEI